MKPYNQAPLPFMGQKRKFLKQFREKLKECSPNYIYVDLFGGSGLLSRTVKDYYPEAKVVYNDYDNFRRRIDALPTTNLIIEKIRLLASPYPKNKRLPEPVKNEILAFIKKFDSKMEVDYITLSANLLFSMKYVTTYQALTKETFYNVVRQSPYESGNYLDGLEIVSLDYKLLYQSYAKKDNVIFLVDPPYLSTEVGTYKNYWKLKDYLDVLKVLNNATYFYFTSNKSQIVELCDWMSTVSNYKNPFKDACVTTTHQQMNYNSSYTDIMLYKSTVNYQVKP